MFRSAPNKMMWVGRATVFLIGVAVILALLFGAASTALAANGNPFLLGKKNVASTVSTLVKQGPGPALNLVVQSGQPPLKVNSSGKVANLNADKLDGKSSEGFYAAGSKVADSSHADQADNATNANHAANAASAETLDGKDSTEFAPAGLFGQAVSPTAMGGGSDCIIGEVRLFAGVRMGGGWQLAEGQLLSISTNQPLYSLLGTNYGGDGQNNFALPDLRGAEPKGAGPQAPAYAICVEGIFPA